MRVLKSRLYEKQQDEKRAEMEKFYGEKGEMGWGNQIRSYVFQPYQMVKDLRTGVETSAVQSVMDGELDSFVNGWLRAGCPRQRTRTFKSTIELVSLSVEEVAGLREKPLFAGKTWRWSPQSWPLLPENQEVIASLGFAAVSFYRAIERLYLKSKDQPKEFSGTRNWLSLGWPNTTTLANPNGWSVTLTAKRSVTFCPPSCDPTFCRFPVAWL